MNVKSIGNTLFHHQMETRRLCLFTWLFTFPILESTFAAYLDTPLSLLRIISLLMLGICELADFPKYHLDDWIIAGMLIPFAISAVISRETSLFQGLLVAFFVRRDDIKVVAETAFLSISVSVGLVLLAFLFGLSSAVDMPIFDSRGVRETLGFVWPSRFPNYVLGLTWLYLFSIWDGQAKHIVIILAIINIAAFVITETRNTAVFALLTYILLFTTRLWCPLLSRRWITRCLGLSFVLCCVGIFMLSFVFSPSVPWMERLDSLMSHRLLYSHTAMEQGAITLFGSTQFTQGVVEHSITGYFDSSYLRLIYHYGIIPSLIFLACLSINLFDCIRRSPAQTLVLFCVALHAVMEGQLLLMYYSPFLLLMLSTCQKRLRLYLSCKDNAREK